MHRMLTSPRRRFGAVALATAGAIAVTVGSSDANDETREQIEASRALLQQWADIRKTMSAERQDWRTARTLILQESEIVREQISQVRARITERRQEAEEALEQQREKDTESLAYAESEAVFEDRIAALERRVRELLPRLPKGLRSELDAIVQQFADPAPADDAPLAWNAPATASPAPRSSLSARYAAVVTALTGINRFNRSVHVVTEILTPPGGDELQVSVLYAGIGHAWFVDATNTRAGYGRSTDAGWEWIAADASAAQIRDAVSVARDGRMASFASLPVGIK